MRTLTVEYGQTLVDIAVQAFGTADGLSTICNLNDLEFDEDLPAGLLLILPDADLNNDVLQYMINKNVKVNSHLTEQELEVLSVDDNEPIVDNDNNYLQL